MVASSVQRPVLHDLRSTRLPEMKAAARRAASQPAAAKTLHLLRHGETEMNAYLAQAGPGYADPLMYDTVLTDRGKQQAAAAATVVPQLSPQPELIVCSPLTRALQTADLAFAGFECKRVISHWAAERLYHASDVGRLKAELIGDWAHFDAAELPDGVWWHSESPEDVRAVCQQDDASFEARVNRLRMWLHQRPERCIAVVSHWGVLAALSGRGLRNAEFYTIEV